VTEMIGKVAADFKVSAVQGVLSHELKRNTIDGPKVILNRADLDQKVDEIEFAPNEVYAIDIVMSTGDGKPNEVDEKTTIYKRAKEVRYNLKRQASRQMFGDVLKKFPHFPFHIRDLDAKTRGFGIKECREHELLHSYPVLSEKEGDVVAHFKATVLLLPSGAITVTGVPFDLTQYEPTLQLKDEGLRKLLAQSAGAKKKKKKPKKPKKKAAGGGGGGGPKAAAAAAEGGEEEEEEEEEEGEVDS